MKTDQGDVEIAEISIMPSGEVCKDLDIGMIATLYDIASKCCIHVLSANWLFGTPGHLEMQLILHLKVLIARPINFLLLIAQKPLKTQL